MDVQLPDGTVVKGIPEGTTKAQLAEKLKANGRDVPQEWLAPKSKKQYPGSYGYTTASRAKGDYASASDDPSQVGITGALESVDKGIYEAGGKVTDVASKMGAPPNVAGGLGYAANVALQATPMGLGGSAAKIASPALKELGRKSMQSALKPTLKALRNGDAAVAIDTMLEQGFNVTKGGVEKIREKILELNYQIKDAIANSTETINKADVGSRLLSTLDRFKKQVNPQADMAAIKRAWLDFRNHPLLAGKTEMPVQLAQDLKQGTYKQIQKKYGELGSADTEAQKALARGLKEEIAAKVPQVSRFNEEETKLIRTLNVVERRSLMELNKNPGGLAWLSHDPKTFALYMADKSALFKSLAARFLYSGADDITTTVARSGITVGQIATQKEQ